MSETRKIAAILVSDMVGYSRLARADEDRTLSRLRGLRSDLIDPTRPPFVFWAHAMPGQLLSGVCLRMYEPRRPDRQARLASLARNRLIGPTIGKQGS